MVVAVVALLMALILAELEANDIVVVVQIIVMAQIMALGVVVAWVLLVVPEVQLWVVMGVLV